jgi:hypothetical protein
MAADLRSTAQHGRQKPRTSPSDTPMPYSWNVMPGSDLKTGSAGASGSGRTRGSRTCAPGGAPRPSAMRRAAGARCGPHAWPAWPGLAGASGAEPLAGPPRPREVAGLQLHPGRACRQAHPVAATRLSSKLASPLEPKEYTTQGFRCSSVRTPQTHFPPSPSPPCRPALALPYCVDTQRP